MHIPVELQEALKRGECVLFVGAGFSEGLPTWKELMKPLAEELKMDPDEDPLYIAEYYESKFKRPKLEKMIVDQVNKDVPLTEAHRLLTKLPVKAIITTNYDHLLEKALSQKNFIKVVEGMKAPQIREDQLPLVKMHGDIDDTSTMVITKTDYNEYPEKHRALITYLLGFLISYNFLFVGFGLRDPNFDNIYYQIKSLFKDNQRKSYTIVKNPSDYEVESLNRMGIEVITVDDYDKIPQIFEELAAICTERVKIDMTSRQLEGIQNSFREVVERQNKWLDPRGIFQFDRMLTRREVELDEIYVVPRLVKQKVIRKRKREPEEKKTEKKKKKKLKDEMYTEEVEDYFFEKKVELSIKNVLSDTKSSHMVILGDPGVGKSCLLQYTALKASTNAGESLGIEKQLLPVLIPLREYLQFGSKKMLKEFIFDYIQKKICFLPENVLESFLEKNLFFFLLDGLDEVVSESQRIDVSREVEQFMAQYPRMKIVLTSRPAGYRPAALIGSIPHFTLADFNDDEIKEFLVKWFTFLDKIEEEKFDKAKTEKKAYDLADIILKRKKILRLARNPLLLTILVLIHRVGRKLPQRRAEFYDLAVRTISGTWEAWKNLETYKNRELPDQEIILALLENIGFRLHSEKQENVVGVEELKIWLRDAMEQEMGHSSPKGINDFLWMLKERAGLLVEKGLGLYGFVHLTFQEYFAARYIAVGRGVKLAENLIKKYLHSSHWREVILLAAATASPEQTNLILKSVLETENPFEEYIHSNLMAAGLILADLPRVDPLERSRVIEKLISLTSSGNFDLLRIDALEVLAEIGRTSPPEDVSWSLELLHDENLDVRWQAVTYFTTLGKDYPEIKKEIFRLLRDEDKYVRRQALQYFTTLRTDDPEIKKEIFRLLRDRNSDVRRQALQYFTTLRTDDPEIKKEIFRLLRDRDPEVCRQALQYFTTLRTDDPEIKKEIFRLLRDRDPEVCRQALQYSTALGTDDPEIKKEIFRLLRSKDSEVCRQAVQHFTTLGTDDPEIKKEISGLLRDENSEVCRQAVQYFTTLGTDDPEIRKKIFRLLRFKDSDIRRQAVQYFTTLGTDDPKVKKEIFRLLHSKDSKVRRQALQYFTTLGIDDPEIKKEISGLLRDRDSEVCRQALQYFTTLGTDDPEIKKEISGLLRDESSEVCRQALQYFTTLGTDDPEIKKEISGLLRDRDSEVCRQALQYFTTLGIDDPEIKKEISGLLRDRDSEVCRQAVQYFTTLGTDDPEIRKKIFWSLHDRDSDICRRAVQYFTTLGTDDPKVKKEIFRLLRDEIYLPSLGKTIQDIAVEFLSQRAREESSKEVPYLFISDDLPTKRGAYTLMKALIQTQEDMP
ncbi:MAG: HEAT repeat domain-containing protein [Theionarchaea archaeon]|nr:HEAT repeat domain-containing protein [Theionarchaea archaeon]